MSAPTIDEMIEKLKQQKPMPWDGGYCERCNNTGYIDCHCGGDLCVCDNQGERICPRCHGESMHGAGEFPTDDYDY